MARPFRTLGVKAEAFVRLEARGEDRKTILQTIFGLDVDKDDKKLINKADQQMYRWRHHPGAEEIWQDEVKQQMRLYVPRAVSRIGKQIDDENGWLANKASNDVLTMAKNAGVLQTEEKALSVKIEGMPDIGSPDDDV